MNLINAKYGNDPDITAYTHVSDQFGPFASQKIPATVNEVPFILDGLLTTDAGRKIKEQYADTGDFTDHTFALTSLLGYQFVPRIRDLPSRRLFLFDPAAAPKNLRGMIGDKIRQNLICDHPLAERHTAYHHLQAAASSNKGRTEAMRDRVRAYELFLRLGELEEFNT